MMKRLFPSACLIAFAALPFTLATAAASATECKLLPDGNLHTVSIDTRTGSGTTAGGTKVVDRIQKPDGTIDVKTVPGTDDRVFESDPSLTVSPATGLPVLVFARQNDAAWDICFSMYDGYRWSGPQYLVMNGSSNRRPRVVAGRSGNFYVIWETATADPAIPAYYETILDPRGASILPPVPIGVPAEVAIPLQAGPPSPGVITSDMLFAFAIAPTLDKQKIICFGGIDDPVPVVHRFEFSLPEGAPLVDHAKIEKIGTQLVVLARQPKALLYSIGSATAWTTFQSIGLETLSEEKAELLIKEAIARTAPR